MPELEDERLLAPLLLAKARTDLAAATAILERREDIDMEPWPAAFHAQQAAEKALKALLVEARIDPPYTHDLDSLTKRLPGGLNVGASGPEIDALNKFSTAVRYVFRFGDPPDPGWEDAEGAVTIARAIVAAAAEQIRGQ